MHMLAKPFIVIQKVTNDKNLAKYKINNKTEINI
jgi:hypothetical protein